MPTGKNYEVVVAFERVDKEGNSKRYEPGDTYSGEDIEKYLKGVDDQGPLIRDKSDSNTNVSSPSPDPSGPADSSKGK